MNELEEFERLDLPPELVRTAMMLVSSVIREKKITDIEEKRKMARIVALSLYEGFKKEWIVISGYKMLEKVMWNNFVTCKVQIYWHKVYILYNKATLITVMTSTVQTSPAKNTAKEFDYVPCKNCDGLVLCEIDPDTGRAMWEGDNRCGDCWAKLNRALAQDSEMSRAYFARG